MRLKRTQLIILVHLFRSRFPKATSHYHTIATDNLPSINGRALHPMATYTLNYEVIPYLPPPLPVSIYWRTAIDVLAHLRDSPKERRSLLDEVQRQTRNHPRYFIIYHPLLRYDLLLHSRYNDHQFRIAVHSIWMLEQIPPFRRIKDGHKIRT